MTGIYQTFKKHRFAYGLLLPSLTLLLIFSIIPIFIAAFISFTDMDLSGISNWANIEFVGITNYINLFKDGEFLQAVFNTGFYVVIGVPLVIICSLGVAMLLNYGTSALYKVSRAVYYTPAITNIIAISVVWGFLYNTQYGLFNYILEFFGAEPVMWLQDPVIAKLSLILLAVWKSLGINMIIFLAALKGIPKSLYEAASIDGANKIQTFFKITLPSLKFSIFFVTVTTLIGWIQFFEEPFVMTQGGPLNSTNSMALYIYQNGFQRSEFGFAAAGSVALFAIIIVVTLVQMKLRKKEEEY